MRMIPEVQLKQPSLQLYLWCLGKNDYIEHSPKDFPLSIRARIINTYRRIVKNGLKEHTPPNPEESKPEGKRILRRKKVRRRRLRLVNKGGSGSKKNSIVRSSLKKIIRWTSGGRGRPSRKQKIQYVSSPLTLHLKGNKYGDGHHV